MTTTLVALVNAEGALRRLCAQSVNVKLAYRLARLVKLVAAETADYHAQRDALVKELGVERPVTEADKALGLGYVGTLFEVTPQNTPAFGLKMRELGDVKVSVSDWRLTVDLLGDARLSGEDMLALGPLIDDEASPPRIAPSKATRKGKPR